MQTQGKLENVYFLSEKLYRLAVSQEGDHLLARSIQTFRMIEIKSRALTNDKYLGTSDWPKIHGVIYNSYGTVNIFEYLWACLTLCVTISQFTCDHYQFLTVDH